MQRKVKGASELPRKCPKSAPGATKGKKTGKAPKKPRTLTQLKKELWDLYSRSIRLESADREGFCECYTCGERRPWKLMHAGHGIGGRGNAVLFERRIIRVQCPQCNLKMPWALAGNYQVFIPKLIKEIGEKVYTDIELASRQIKKIPKAWYVDEIAAMKSMFSLNKRLDSL